LLSHEHYDHTKGVERFSARHGVPVVCSRATLEAINLSPIHLARWHPLETEVVQELEGVNIDSFPVPHDAVDPVGFVLEGEGVRVGMATDLGHATTLVTARLKGCHVLLVESNHDERMLREGPYPWSLKQRVGGRLGHLSNHNAAALLQAVTDTDCRAVILVHLSEKNNTPDLARKTASNALAALDRGRMKLRVAGQNSSNPPITL
jgi:phosphoribosyl 1,2-cyclic phosphodiesterase